MDQKPTIPRLFSYDEVDAFVASVFTCCERLFKRSKKSDVEPPFSDEWERKQMARELRWN
jgi:hypothetical protein